MLAEQTTHLTAEHQHPILCENVADLHAIDTAKPPLTVS